MNTRIAMNALSRRVGADPQVGGPRRRTCSLAAVAIPICGLLLGPAVPVRAEDIKLNRNGWLYSEIGIHSLAAGSAGCASPAGRPLSPPILVDESGGHQINDRSSPSPWFVGGLASWPTASAVPCRRGVRRIWPPRKPSRVPSLSDRWGRFRPARGPRQRALCFRISLFRKALRRSFGNPGTRPRTGVKNVRDVRDFHFRATPNIAIM